MYTSAAVNFKRLLIFKTRKQGREVGGGRTDREHFRIWNRRYIDPKTKYAHICVLILVACLLKIILIF